MSIARHCSYPECNSLFRSLLSSKCPVHRFKNRSVSPVSTWTLAPAPRAPAINFDHQRLNFSNLETLAANMKFDDSLTSGSTATTTTTEETDDWDALVG